MPARVTALTFVVLFGGLAAEVSFGGSAGCCSWGGWSCGDCGNDGTGWCHKSSGNCARCKGKYISKHPPACGGGGRRCCSWGGKCGDCGNDGTGWCHKSSGNCKKCTGKYINKQPPKCSSRRRRRVRNHGGGGELYCPVEKDLNVDYGSPKFVRNGWIVDGGGRVSSKTSWNLLGGYIEFEMDTKRTQPGVNANLYTSSPSQPNCGMKCYCDIQKGNFVSCMEMDIIEANGNCQMANVWHTWPNHNGGCDRAGCAAHAHLHGRFTIKASFSMDGWMTVKMNGHTVGNYDRHPSEASKQHVVKTMKSIGACIESSQWKGWAPMERACPGGGNLDHSHYEIHNVRVKGIVIQGPEPTKCSALSSFLVDADGAVDVETSQIHSSQLVANFSVDANGAVHMKDSGRPSLAQTDDPDLIENTQRPKRLIRSARRKAQTGRV